MSLDIATVRTSLGTCLAGLGFNVFDYDPEEIPSVDAVVVGLPLEIQYHASMGVDARLSLPITFYFGTAGEQAAHRRLDAALSWKSGAAVYQFELAARALNGTSPWRSMRVETAENVRRVPSPGGHILAVDVLVSVL